MYLRDNGATVEMTDDVERAAFRAGRGVPDEAAGCHTGVVGDFVVEGHVPAEAIARLLADRPDAVGIALPGMPSDSPGMGGDTAAWAKQRVMLIDRDGALSPFVF